MTQLGEKPRFGTHRLLNEPKRQWTPMGKNGLENQPKQPKNGDTKTRFSTYKPHTRTHTHASYPTKVVSHVSPIGKSQ